MISEKEEKGESEYENIFDKNGRVFVERDSLVTILLGNEQFVAISSFLVSTLIFFTVNMFLNWSDKNASFPIKESFIFWYKYDWLNFAWIWLLMFCHSLLVHPLVACHCISSGTTRKMLVILYVIFLTHFAYLTSTLMLAHCKSSFSFAGLVMEQIRLLMKIHSYFRENQRLSAAGHPRSPTIKQYLYFSFAPTLIYRDSYPRTEHIRWGFVVTQLLQVLCSGLVIYNLFEFYFVPEAKSFIDKPFTVKNLYKNLMMNSVPGILANSAFYYGFLHCWMNAWAEVLRFGDRLFYMSWWTSVNYSEYYRRLNTIVQDWIRTYMFDEIRHHLPNTIRNKAATGIIIILSALLHDYAFSLILKKPLPIFMLLYGVIGLIFHYVRSPRSESKTTNMILNLIFIWNLMHGNGIVISSYFYEYFSMQRLPLPSNATFADKLVPTLFRYKIQQNAALN